MQDPIGQLEERVDRALARMRRLTEERDRLQDQVRQLREGSEAPASDSDLALAREDRDTILTGLRRTLAELRAE